MRVFNFDLSKYEGVTGTLELGIPSYRERLKMIKECNFKMNSEGEISVGLDSIDSIVKLIDVTRPFYKVIDVKLGELEIKDFDTLESYAEFDSIITEASSAIMNAGKLGK